MVFPSDLVLDANGNIYSMGSISETVDFNPGSGTANLNTSGDDDVYISKLDKNGAYVWARVQLHQPFVRLKFAIDLPHRYRRVTGN